MQAGVFTIDSYWLISHIRIHFLNSVALFPFLLTGCVAECNSLWLVRVLGSKQQVTLVAFSLSLILSLFLHPLSLALFLPLNFNAESEKQFLIVSHICSSFLLVRANGT